MDAAASIVAIVSAAFAAGVAWMAIRYAVRENRKDLAHLKEVIALRDKNTEKQLAQIFDKMIPTMRVPTIRSDDHGPSTE
jgi:hypothetical protein